MCRTEQVKPDFEMQLNDLRRYCQVHSWEYDEVFEYCSGNGNQPKLKDVLEKVRLKHYNVLLVHSMARFSLEQPSKTYETLSLVVDSYQCRFISLFEGIDSGDSVRWSITMRLFPYFVNMFTRHLSIKDENGIKNQNDHDKDTGKHLGRPKKDIDSAKLMDIKKTGLSLRRAVEVYNNGLPPERWISRSKMAQALSEQGT
jgi:DNA invertase Pin-like site-specific DNA recombinase